MLREVGQRWVLLLLLAGSGPAESLDDRICAAHHDFFLDEWSVSGHARFALL
jgi:hypothetical protein